WIFFRRTRFTELSAARIRRILPDYRELHWICWECSFARFGAAGGRSLSAARKNSFAGGCISFVRPRGRLVGSMVILGAWLFWYHGHRHRSFSLPALSPRHRHAGQ